MYKHFKEVLPNINVQPLLRQINDHPELWNTDSVRTSVAATVHYNVDDIILRYTGRGENWNSAALNILNEAQPIVFRLMARVWGELLGRVIISKLPPGKIIPKHKDRMPINAPMFYQRFQIPIVGEPGVEFHIEDEQLYLEPGKAYWIANTLDHWVINNSNRDRISMVVDIRPFTPL